MVKRVKTYKCPLMFLSSWIHFHWGMRVEKYFHLRKLTLHFRMQPTMPVFLSPRMTYPYPWKTLPSTKKKKNANHNFGSVWQIRRKQYCYWRIPSPSERHTEVYYNASPTGKSSVAPLLPFLSLLPPTTTQAHTPKKKKHYCYKKPLFLREQRSHYGDDIKYVTGFAKKNACFCNTAMTFFQENLYCKENPCNIFISITDQPFKAAREITVNFSKSAVFPWHLKKGVETSSIYLLEQWNQTHQLEKKGMLQGISGNL